MDTFDFLIQISGFKFVWDFGFLISLYLPYPSDFTTLSISSYVMNRRRCISL